MEQAGAAPGCTRQCCPGETGEGKSAADSQGVGAAAMRGENGKG
nr:MAG TPA_asm: hypothetical protein [Caudoviricetes sp.]